LGVRAVAPEPSQAAPPGAAHPTQPSRSPPGAIPPLPDDKKYHVFLTHDWGQDEKGEDNHAYVSRINDALKAEGFETW
jgi:hypothetical protein